MIKIINNPSLIHGSNPAKGYLRNWVCVFEKLCPSEKHAMYKTGLLIEYDYINGLQD